MRAVKQRGVQGCRDGGPSLKYRRSDPLGERRPNTRWSLCTRADSTAIRRMPWLCKTVLFNEASCKPAPARSAKSLLIATGVFPQCPGQSLLAHSRRTHSRESRTRK